MGFRTLLGLGTPQKLVLGIWMGIPKTAPNNILGCVSDGWGMRGTPATNSTHQGVDDHEDILFPL